MDKLDVQNCKSELEIFDLNKS